MTAPSGADDVEGLQADVDIAAQALRTAIATTEGGAIELLKSRLEATQRYYHLLGLVLSIKKEHQDGTKAEAVALRAEKQLVDAHKASIVTRVEQLEEQLRNTRTRGDALKHLLEP